MKGWKLVRLGDVCELINGRAYKKAELLSEGKYPVLRVGNFFSNRSWYYSDLELDDNKYCDDGDLLYAWSASFGPRIWQGGKVIYHYHIWKTDLKLDKVDKKFLYHWFAWDTEKIKAEQGVGTTMIHVTKGAMEDRTLHLPPIAQQKQIVAILDEAFEGIDGAIANTEKNFANARELFESYLNAVFVQKGNEWEWASLSDITTDITDGDHQPPPKTKSGIPFITISNIDKQNRTIDFSDTFKVPPEYFGNLKENRKPRRGDVLYTVTGSYAIPVVVDHDMEFCFQRHIGLIRPDAETNPKCLYYMLLSRHLLQQAHDCATGTAQKTVSLRALRKFSVPRIPKKEQDSIVKDLEGFEKQIKRLEAIYQQKLAALNELKQSILQKAFSGELTAEASDAAVEGAKEVVAA